MMTKEGDLDKKGLIWDSPISERWMNRSRQDSVTLQQRYQTISEKPSGRFAALRQERLSSCGAFRVASPQLSLPSPPILGASCAPYPPDITPFLAHESLLSGVLLLFLFLSLFLRLYSSVHSFAAFSHLRYCQEVRGPTYKRLSSPITLERDGIPFRCGNGLDSHENIMGGDVAFQRGRKLLNGVRRTFALVKDMTQLLVRFAIALSNTCRLKGRFRSTTRESSNFSLLFFQFLLLIVSEPLHKPKIHRSHSRLHKCSAHILRP